MPTEQLQPVRRALLSVSDKTGLVEFAQALAEGGVAILSTGGTAKLLKEKGIDVTDVQDHTGFPEIMGGRVKTLHPKIHGGILGREEVDQEAMQEHGIEPIDLVVINLYPFEQTIQKADCTLEQAIENIDIGGPAMLRAAAKNHARVSVVVDPSDYSSVLEHLQQNNMSTQANIRLQLANKAFAHTSHYDSAITTYLSQHTDEDNAFPQELRLSYTQKQALRYGENPHQSAAFYTRTQVPSGTVSSAKVLQGKELSFNNIADTDAALECVKQFDQTACVIVKHANPCGVGVAETLNDAYQLAYSTDPTSAFGGIIAFNKPLDAQTTQAILDQQFVEVIIAPEIEAEAIEVLKTKPNIRALTCGTFENESRPLDLKHIQGGLLLQDSDTAIVQAEQLKVVTKRVPTEEETHDLIFAWRVAKFVKSNAIVYARDQRTIGVGAGQMSRVYSAKIAGIKAQDENLQVAGSVMASDAFFPFRDGLDAANEAGIKAVIQPGGSMKDDEVIAAADEHGMAMVFTGIRHFRH